MAKCGVNKQLGPLGAGMVEHASENDQVCWILSIVRIAELGYVSHSRKNILTFTKDALVVRLLYTKETPPAIMGI